VHTKEYKMLPIAKTPGAYVLKVRKKVPALMRTAKKTAYRILVIKDMTATICANMKVLTGGELSVVDVSIQSLGRNSVKVGDVLSYESHDIGFDRPMIAFREHQKHQHPDQLVAPDEV
jgi:hypothetical protein